MKKLPLVLTGVVFGSGLLLAIPSVALAHDDRPHVGINLSFGVPVYEQPAYVYAPSRPVYLYQPRTEYYQRGYEGDHRRWRGDREERRHHDDNDDNDD